MKRLFLSILLIVMIIPAAFSFGAQFDYFAGTGNGFDLGFWFGDGLIRQSYGIIYEKSSYKKTEEYSSYSYWSGTTITEESERKSIDYFGGYYQVDCSIMPFTFGPVDAGFNFGLQVASGYSSAVSADLCLNPFIGIQAHIWQFDVTMGWKGSAHIVEMVSDGRKFDDEKYSYDNKFRNCFKMGVRYKFGSSSSSGSGSSSSGSPSQENNIYTKILPGSNIIRIK